jgi:hypothetical protein
MASAMMLSLMPTPLTTATVCLAHSYIFIMIYSFQLPCESIFTALTNAHLFFCKTLLLVDVCIADVDWVNRFDCVRFPLVIYDCIVGCCYRLIYECIVTCFAM